MTTILETRFPSRVETSFKGSPFRFQTTVHDKARGRTSRNVNWTQARGLWTLSVSSIKSRDDFDAVNNLIAACRGRAYGFLFLDRRDSHCDSAVETGGTYYKPYRAYEDDGTTVAGEYLRPITRRFNQVGSGDGASFDFLVPVAFTEDYYPLEWEGPTTDRIDSISIEEVIE